MELLPCPFCGCEINTNEQYSPTDGYIPNSWYKIIRCKECDATMRGARGMAESCTNCEHEHKKSCPWEGTYRHQGPNGEKIRVCNAWNRRTVPEPSCEGCRYEEHRPSEIHCHGCARMYVDHYESKMEDSDGV
jgi:hypothetical protein